jgi:HEAT repeat protein
MGRGRGAAQAGRGECNDEDDDRLIALNALLQMQAEQAIPILRQVLQRRDEGSVCLRRQAVFLVSQKKSPETAKILLDAVRGDPDPEVRENAVFWLSQAPSSEAVPALDPELQDKAVFALSQVTGDPAASRALRAHLERADTPDRIKGSIILWLGQQKSTEAAQYLKDFFAKTSSAELKEKVLFALAQNGMEENGRWLLDVALDANSSIELRKNALFWAAQSKSVPFADLARLYDRSTDMELKDQLIFGFSQSKDPAAVDKLMSIARTESNRDLRGKAIFWLGQSHDPRVAQFLLEVISK